MEATSLIDTSPRTAAYTGIIPCQKIVEMVANAQRSRAPIQKLVDKAAGVFVPMVIAVAALSFVIWAAVGPEPSFVYAFVVAVTV